MPPFCCYKEVVSIEFPYSGKVVVMKHPFMENFSHRTFIYGKVIVLPIFNFFLIFKVNDS